MRIPILVLLWFIGFNAIVIPNANQLLLILALFLSSFIALYYNNRIKLNKLKYFVLPAISTILYSLIGLINNANITGISQALFIYILSPTLWVLTISLAHRFLGYEKIIFHISIFGILACLSIPIYIYIYENYGPDALSFFGSNTHNINITSDFSGVTMHVLGSLVFISSSFFSQPSVLKNKLLKTFLLISIIGAVLAGGRTISIISLILGLFILGITNKKIILKKTPEIVAFILILTASSYFIIEKSLGVDILSILERHFNKLSGGDVERPEQIHALFQGAVGYLFLGAGHGIGVNYIRSAEFPWRYETVYLALLFKIGFIGFIATIYPIFIAIYRFIKLLPKNNNHNYIVFFGAGLLAAFIASATNPYIEAFSFQWMYLLPIYYFLNEKRNKFN